MFVLGQEVPVASVRSNVQLPLNGSSAQAGRIVSFNGLSGPDHFAVRFGQPATVPLVRVHSECVTGDVFGSLRCDCGTQLQNAIRQMEEAGGWILYLRQEGRGIGLAAKLDAYVLQENGLDTFEANRKLGFKDDERDYADAALMLKALGVREIDLLTGNPEKVSALRRLGIRVRRTVPCDGVESAMNAAYLAAKRIRSLSSPGVKQGSRRSPNYASQSGESAKAIASPQELPPRHLLEEVFIERTHIVAPD